MSTTALSRWETIRKDTHRVPPNLTEAARARFSWEAARARLAGLPSGGLHIAWEAVERHAADPARAGKVAVRWLGRHGARRELTYAELGRDARRFANALGALGLRPQDRVFLLTPRVPELFVAATGALEAGGVVCPLFSAFGPEPVRERLAIGGGRFLVTTPALYERKVAPIRDALPGLETVILVAEAGSTPRPLPPGCVDWATLLAAASSAFTIPPTDPEQWALLHFTSGTTGRPKGAMHVHGAVLHHHVSALYALDLHDDDVFWCTADPGWVTGTSYGIVAPLTHGLTVVVDEADFDAERWYRVLRDEGVSVWYTAPTAVRMMMKVGVAAARRHPLPALRFVASVGEPLDPEAVFWGIEAFGLPIHDNWWQTETGGIMIANDAASEIRPGSMGRALPGIRAAIVRRTAGGAEPVPDGQQGELALRPGWPSMFRGYLGEEARYRACFAGGWYLSGDLATRDADGFFWFVGRADDVIKTAGHLVGPFEVETVLKEHAGVAEAAVIGVPDPTAGEVIKAFVATRPGFEPGEALRREILALARRRLGPVIAPKEIAFVPSLPKTRSGKILRRLLKARELGLPEGDLSTLEREPGSAS